MGALTGKTILITGGTNGLGAELAIAVAKAGADIAVLGRDAAAGDLASDAGRNITGQDLIVDAGQVI